MTKLVMYRNNSAYEQFLAPALKDREGFKIQVFPQGTSEADITAWITEHADHVHGMEKVFMDNTCYYAGRDVRSSASPDGNFWRGVKINLGKDEYFDVDVFRHCALDSLVEKATAEEVIAEIIRLFLQKRPLQKCLW